MCNDQVKGTLVARVEFGLVADFGDGTACPDFCFGSLGDLVEGVDFVFRKDKFVATLVVAGGDGRPEIEWIGPFDTRVEARKAALAQRGY